ncbi:hypothetical protein Tco_1002261 [Tanacetum coccineum]|uniref:Uncharacterized protein n=1 Tax=Tanacetum coccineum TaxID=301880 RepID=A0ABQ5F788_9ASTR
MANILQNHPLRFSIAASSSVPWIYLGQLWHTLKEDGSNCRLSFMLNRKELTLTLDEFRTIFQLPQATDNNHERFVVAPKFSEMVPLLSFMLDRKELTLTLDEFRTIFQLPQAIDNNHERFVVAPKFSKMIMQMLYCFVNNIHVDYSLEYPSTLIPYPIFTKLLVSHYMTDFHEISRRVHYKYHNLEDDEMVKSIFNSVKNKTGVIMKIPSWMITDEMKLMEYYWMYATVFAVDIPTTQSQPIESTQGTHRTTRAPRSPNPDPIFTKLLVSHYMTGVGMKIPSWMITDEMKLMEHYRMYATVFGVDIPTTQSQPIESTQGTHRLTRALGNLSLIWMKEESSAHESISVIRIFVFLQRSSTTPPTPMPTTAEADDIIIQDTIQLSLVEQKSRDELEAKPNVQKVEEHLIAEEIEKLVEGTENVENVEVDSSTLRQNDNQNDPGTRLEPKSNKESPEVEITAEGDLLAIHPRDQDDPHDDAHLEGENSVKRQKTSEHGTYPTPVIQSCQRDPKAPALSLVNQDLLYLKKGNLGPEKIVLSLHKFPAVIFHDDDIEEITSRWVDKYVKKFNPYALYSVEHWKNLHAKILYIKKQKEPGKPKEIIARRANDSIVSIIESDYKNLNKNNIKDMYLLIVNEKVDDYAETGLLWSLSVLIRSVVIWERVNDFQLVLEGLKSHNNNVKYGYVTPTLNKEDVEYLQLFEEGIEERSRPLLYRLFVFLCVFIALLVIKTLELGINALALSDRHPTYHETPSDQVKVDDPNITMEEYIRLEEEKARRRGKVYNWETAKYGKVWDNEDVYDLGSVKIEFPTIVFNDTLTSETTLSCEPTVSSLNNDEIDFKISFDEFDDEDFTVIFDKNSFSYKIISVNDLKMDLENDNDKVNMPLFPSHEPTITCFDDLDFFKDFENEFPAIVYNDGLTSKLDFLTEPTVSPQHIDEFNMKDETSLSEYDEEEQNVICFNDLFPFNVIYLDDSKSDKDHDDDDKIDFKQSLGDNVINTDDGAYAYGVYGYQYGVSWGMDTTYQLPVQYLGPREGKSTNVGGEFTNMEILKCWSLENLKTVVQHNLAQ